MWANGQRRIRTLDRKSNFKAKINGKKKPSGVGPIMGGAVGTQANLRESFVVFEKHCNATLEKTSALDIFHSIDKDHDGRLTTEELHTFFVERVWDETPRALTEVVYREMGGTPLAGISLQQFSIHLRRLSGSARQPSGSGSAAKAQARTAVASRYVVARPPHSMAWPAKASVLQ